MNIDMTAEELEENNKQFLGQLDGLLKMFKAEFGTIHEDRETYRFIKSMQLKTKFDKLTVMGGTI